MKRALCLLRPTLAYRRESFCAGLESLGYRIADTLRDPKPEDVLCIWNRYKNYHDEALRFERAGARVIVTENGYIRTEQGAFALALSHHSGAGVWKVGGPERFAGLGLELLPWRKGGKEAVIFGQRGIGEPGIAAPYGWAYQVRDQLKGKEKQTGLKVRVREHPGNHAASVPLTEDLQRAAVVVTWHSAAALYALALGIPVYSAFSRWIGGAAALPLSEYGRAQPKRCNESRLCMFQRLAWAQWSVKEIQTGEAFQWLLLQ